MVRAQVLLATFNGARFLEEQLQSLRHQTVDEVHMLVSDDGSTDDTLELLREAASGWDRGRFEIIEGPQRAFARNFRHLVENADPSLDCFAFCDQDDVWHPEKLEKAAAFCLSSPDNGLPRVFSSATRLIDDRNRTIGKTKLPRMSPQFGNAILQNIASGNTMVMNRAALMLMRETREEIGRMHHDHWLYLITTGAGGDFHFSPERTVDYRQHTGNAIGGLDKPLPERLQWWFAKDRRLKARKSFLTFVTAVERHRHLLARDASETLDDCLQLLGDKSILRRAQALWRSPLIRKSRLAQAALWWDFVLLR